MSARAADIRVLLADDEPHLGAILEQFLTARGFSVTAVRDGRAALEALRSAPYDVALLDVVMPELDGLEVLRRVREESTPPEILIITGNGTVETALAALRLGAYDVLSKPYRMAEIEALIRRAWEKRLLVRDNQRLRARLAAPASPAPFLTQYAPLRAVLRALEGARDSTSPVMVWGEAGTGKRALARWLHEGRTPDAPFVEMELAAAGTAETSKTDDALVRLFGREGETGTAIGAVELASGGTLLVRAIARAGPVVQRALAAAVERGWFTRVGGSHPVPLEARLVVALMRDPEQLVAEGALDPAVVHPLSAVRVALPPLRDRLVDLPLLTEHLLAGHGGDAPALTVDALAWLETRRWPQNVRELATLLRRVDLEADGGGAGVVTAAMLERAAAAPNPGRGREPALQRPLGAVPVRDGAPNATIDGTFNGTLNGATGEEEAGSPRVGATLADVERAYIAQTLQSVGWHQGRAAEALGISPKTLYRKIREYGFTRPNGRSIR